MYSNSILLELLNKYFIFFQVYLIVDTLSGLRGYWHRFILCPDITPKTLYCAILPWRVWTGPSHICLIHSIPNDAVGENRVRKKRPGGGGELSLKRLKTSTRIKLRCDIGAEITRLGVLITMIKMLRDLMIKAVTCNKRRVM